MAQAPQTNPLDVISAETQPPSDPDPQTRNFEEQLTQDGRDPEHREREEIIKGRRADRKDREQLTEIKKSYADRSFKFLCLWSIGVFVLFLFSGFKLWSFKLPNTVLSVLAGSTTVSVVGLFAIIGKGLFNNTSHKESTPTNPKKEKTP